VVRVVCVYCVVCVCVCCVCVVWCVFCVCVLCGVCVVWCVSVLCCVVCVCVMHTHATYTFKLQSSHYRNVSTDLLKTFSGSFGNRGNYKMLYFNQAVVARNVSLLRSVNCA